VLAFACYLSYGLVLLAPLALVVVVAARPRLRHGGLAWALAGGLVVVAAFTAAGFSWLDGYVLVRERYYQGLASRRPYGYWVWADLAALAACAGPAAAAIVRRAVRARGCAAWLPVAALAAILVADLSGLSKAEVERIWLPFAVWFAAGAVLLPAPAHRGWLAAQAATALLVNHLVLTAW
jgi:methylthioxylose transferase